MVAGHGLRGIHHWLSDERAGLMAANYLLGSSNWIQLNRQKKRLIWNLFRDSATPVFLFFLSVQGFFFTLQCIGVLELFSSWYRRDAEANSGITTPLLTQKSPRVSAKSWNIMSTAKENPCRKFQANFFNKSKCQNCFKPRELHLLTDQDLTQVTNAC